MGVFFPNLSGTCNFFQETRKNMKFFPGGQYFSDRKQVFTAAIGGFI